MTGTTSADKEPIFDSAGNEYSYATSIPFNVGIQDNICVSPCSYVTMAQVSNQLTINGQTATISSVEVTQAIQQYQTLADLKTSLQTTGEPPVPIISGKPAVMRIYFASVPSAQTVTVRVSGVTNDSKTVDLQPNCSEPDQRSHAAPKNCPSIDFYFNPPPDAAGAWAVNLTLSDVNGNEVQRESLNFKSRDTNQLLIHPVSVCSASGEDCGRAPWLNETKVFLSKILPTNSVTVGSFTPLTMDRDSFITPPCIIDNQTVYWFYCWVDSTQKTLGALYTHEDASIDSHLHRSSKYLGIYHALTLDEQQGDGGDFDPAGNLRPSPSAIISDSLIAQVFRPAFENVAYSAAHEIGHSLGLLHTSTDQLTPYGGSPPGCWPYGSRQQGPVSHWPYPTNNIQSGSQFEYGWDWVTHRPIDPVLNNEFMAYCAYSWISPIRYNEAIQALGGGSVPSVASASSGAKPRARTRS